MTEHEQSLKHLSQNDPVMAAIIKRAVLQPSRVRKNHFESLIRSIISQQLSTKAANTIAQRFQKLFGKRFPKPEEVLNISDDHMRVVGLSFQKIGYIKNLAQAVVNGTVNFRKLAAVSDEEVIAILTQIKGIGRWTAEMFLIFSLARPNIFSHGDLGLKNAVKKLYRINPKLHTKKLQQLLQKWHPYQSLASRYLWKSLEFKDEG